jgi:hypothetical protein
LCIDTRHPCPKLQHLYTKHTLSINFFILKVIYDENEMERDVGVTIYIFFSLGSISFKAVYIEINFLKKSIILKNIYTNLKLALMLIH